MTQYHLHLKGYVGGMDFNTESVLTTLAANPDAEVSVLVDSTGGQLATALSISSAFHRHGKVHVHFTGMNASAATISSLGAQRISMDASALYLVHKCSMAVFEWASMNADQLQEYIDSLSKQKTDLEKLDSNVAAMYAARCRKPQADLLALMKTGGWLTASEAKEWGFVDEVTDYAEDIKPHMTEELAMALATASIPIPAIPYANSEDQRTAEPLFTRFISALTALFHSGSKAADSTAHVDEAGIQSQQDNTSQTQTSNTTTINPMKQKPHVEAVLQVEGFTANAEGSVTLTEAQLQSLEDHIAAQETQLTERDNRITALEAEVASLKGVPAAESPAIVTANQGESKQHASKADEYLANLSSAKELYDMVS